MNKLVEAAREFIGTKFRHRGRSIYGLDCAGLVVMSYRACGVDVQDFTLYGREPHRNGLVTHVTAALGLPLPEENRTLMEGDVVVMRFDREPHHLAIVADYTYDGVHAWNIIHADGQSGGVLEQRLTPDMAARITHVFRKGVQ